MSNPYIQEAISDYFAVREGSAVYGEKELIDKSASGQPYFDAWGPIPALPHAPRHKYTFCSSPAANQESIVLLVGVINEWHGKDESFTQKDLLGSADEYVLEVIYLIKTHLVASFREKLANRLITLFKDAKEEDPTCPGIAAGSLCNFYNFLQLHANLKCPTISLTPEYNIYASWRDDRKRVFSVHFLENGDVRFVIFKPNDRHPERQIRLSVIATTDVLKETSAPYGVWEWISE